MARDIFVSYSQPDFDCAMEMVTRVEREGIDCWIAPRDIAPSADWAAEIIDAISRSRVMILVFSASSNGSPQVRREVERAVSKQVSILPFRIENVLPSKSLEYFLSAQHWLDAFPPPREPHYARLCAYLKSAGTRSDPSQPDPSRPDPGANAELIQSFPAAASHAIDPSEMLRVERSLAGFIGPIAKHLVKAAALRASSVEELVGRVAMELETETERHEFTQRFRQSSPPRL
jgi:TIR domain